VRTIGFSAFLRLLSHNDKRQKSELNKRLGPSRRGYDFHKSMRLCARRYVVDGESLEDVTASTGTIARLPERQSAVAALQRLALWREATSGTILRFSPATYESPRHLFKVGFEPDFGLLIGGKATALHIWNTKTPKLSPGAVYAALTLIAEAYRDKAGAPKDLGVLSVREPVTLYLLSEAADWSGVATAIVRQFEEVFQGPRPSPAPPEDRPTP
jgi:hypothetical protein